MKGKQTFDCPGTIGGRIRQRREEIGLSKPELAKKLGLSLTALNDRELNKTAVTVPEVETMARYLKTTPEYLGWGISRKNISLYESLGLDDAAIKGLQEHNEVYVASDLDAEPPIEEDFSYIQPDPALNKALASPVILEALSQYMSYTAESNGYYVGMTRAQQGEGYVDCRMSNGMYQAVLGQNLLRILDAVKRGEEPELYTASMIF